MRNPCEDCGKGVCDYPECFALKVYSATLKSRKARQDKKKAANRIANAYHYGVVEKAMRKGEWRYR